MSKDLPPARQARVEKAPDHPAIGSPAWNAAYDRHRLEIALRMGRFFVGHLIRLYEAFDGDLTQVIVLGEIGHHNATRAHDESRRLRARGGPRPPVVSAELLPCNAFSISQATGIPRETVRRKIATLVRRGWVMRNPRGEVSVTAAVGARFMPLFNRETLAELLTLAGELSGLLAGGQVAAPVAEERAVRKRERPAQTCSRRNRPSGI